MTTALVPLHTLVQGASQLPAAPSPHAEHTAAPKDPDAIYTDAEAEDIARLERVIEKGLKAGLKAKTDIGLALLEIKEKKLYRPEKGVIEYAVKRFGVGRTDVSNFMGFAEVQLVLTDEKLTGTITNDAQHRSLLSLLNRQHRKEGEGLGSGAKETIVKVVKAVAEAAKDQKVRVTAEMVLSNIKKLSPPQPSESKGRPNKASQPQAKPAVQLLPLVVGFEHTASVYFEGTDAQADALQGVLHDPERNGGDGEYDLICGTNDPVAFLTTVGQWFAANAGIKGVEIVIERTAQPAVDADEAAAEPANPDPSAADAESTI